MRRLLDLLQRHVVFQQRGGIDQHLVLLAVAAHDEDLGDARDLEQPRPDHPVGGRPQVHLLLQRRGERRPRAIWPATIDRGPAFLVAPWLGRIPGDLLATAPAAQVAGLCRSRDARRSA